jgi:anthranilate phosphoribosyltransferase
MTDKERAQKCIKGILTSLHAHGYTDDEIAGLLDMVREFATLERLDVVQSVQATLHKLLASMGE